LKVGGFSERLEAGELDRIQAHGRRVLGAELMLTSLPRRRESRRGHEHDVIDQSPSMDSRPRGNDG
jgi:hypothetical protein